MSPEPRARRTTARHAKLSSPSTASQVMKFVAISLAVVLVAGLGVGGYAVWDLARTFTGNAVVLEGQESVPPDIGEIQGGVNLLVVGTDECEPEFAAIFGDRCSGSDAGGQLNDVNMLVHISDEPRRVTVVSFPRDLMVPIPSCTNENGHTSSAMRKQQINSAFSYGGLNCVVKTVSELSGQDIPFAAKVSFGGVINITDAIGGVDVCLASPIRDIHTAIDWPAGIRNVQGVEALQFLRTRHGVGDGGDLGRISNQQQYMSRLSRKLISQDVLSNPATLYRLASTAVANVTPSSTLTNPLTLVQIALAVKNVPFDEIVFVQYPTVPDPADPNRVAPNSAAATALWDAIEANEPLRLTGELSQGDGVIAVDPAPTESPAATPGPTDSPSPTPTAIELPSSIAGQTAAQETCSNGRVN